MEKKHKKNTEINAINLFKRGLKYGLITLGVAFLMGAIDGMFYLAPLQPAMAFTSFVGVCVFLNLVLAIVLGIGWSITFLITRKQYLIPKYFLISAGFGVVYLVFFGILKIGNLYYF